MKHLLITLFLVNSLAVNAQLLNNPKPNEIDLQLNSLTNPIEVLRIGNEAFRNNQFADYQKAMEKLVELRPNNTSFVYKLAEAYALNDKKTLAFNTLIKLQKLGVYYDIASNDNFANINRYPVFKYIKDNIDVSGNHYGKGTEVFNIDKSFSGLLFESMAFDTSKNDFYMGSVRDGRVIKIANSGEITTLINPTEGGIKGPWAVNDMVIDSKNDLLWMASTAVTHYAKSTQETLGMAGIFKYQLSTGKLLDSTHLPQQGRPHFVSSMAVSEDGKVYFLESFKGSVLQVNDDKSFKVLTSSDKLKNLKSLAIASNGSHLYFNDSEYGLFGLNLKTNQPFELGDNDLLNTTGISDIMFQDNSLFIIQNGFNPQRLMRLDLSPSQNQVIKILPLESAHPKFNFPSHGVAIGDSIFYIANSQMPKTNHLGGLLKDKSWDHMYVIQSLTSFQENESEEYNKYIEGYKKDTGVK